MTHLDQGEGNDFADTLAKGRGGSIARPAPCDSLRGANPGAPGAPARPGAAAEGHQPVS
jgi:hypothetical protein